MKNESKTYKLVLCAIMIAIAIVLNRIVPATPIYHLSLDFLAIFVIAVSFGPIYSTIAYGIADTLASIILPYGAYNPGITLSLMLIGLCYGLIFYMKEGYINSNKLFIAKVALVSAIVLLIKLFITTYFLYIMYGGGDTYIAYLITRIPNCAAIAIANVILLPIVYKIIRRFQY